MKMLHFFKTGPVPQVLPALLKKPINDGPRVQGLLSRPANDSAMHRSVRSRARRSGFAQAREIKNAVERFHHLLILSFFSSLGPR
jgi:hypothetical protein